MELKWLMLMALFAIAKGQFPFAQVAKTVGQGAQQVASTPLKAIGALNNFGDFQSAFKKTYATPALAKLAEENFLKNKLDVANFNDATAPFKLALNSFADLVLDEFNKIYNGFKGGNLKDRSSPYQPENYVAPKVEKLPENVDWREKGAVSPVKFQGSCASCHAFSAAGAVEGHNFRKNGVLRELSPQNLLDCPQTKNFQSFGCAGGGYVDEDLKYIWKNPGINELGKYAYEGKDGQCRFDQKGSETSITGYTEIPEGDEKAMEKVVAELGPVAVGIDANHTTFQFYKDGVYYEKDCKNDGPHINHAMLVVGYGVEPDGQKYWLVKNSYGTDWGIDGYIKIAKDKDNHCGIATSAVYPIV